MMKHTLLFALLLLAGCSASDDPAAIPEPEIPEVPEVPETLVEIPDATLRKYLIKDYDTDQDGEISTTEAEKVVTLYIPQGVRDLTGIEAFKNIISLYIDNGIIITELKVDWSLLPKLTNLGITTNTIEQLEIRNAPALQEFRYRDYRSLDDMVSSLRKLSIYDCPALESILYEGGKNSTLAELQIAGCPSIESLQFSQTALHTLPHAGLPNLKRYSMYDNDTPVESIDLSHNGELTYFSCSRNGLTTLDLSHCPKLQQLGCTEPIQELDLSPCPQLTWLSCENTELSQLDISKNPALEYCYLQNNPKLEKIFMRKIQELFLIAFRKDEHTTITYID